MKIFTRGPKKDRGAVPEHTPGPQKKDVLGWAATGFALVVTFSAEYELAMAVGIDHVVALAVPGALDVFVLRALQVKRDVFLAVLAMIAVNAASHLVTAGVLVVEWPLIVAVSAIAPIVLWRVHVLGGFRGAAEWSTWRKAKLHDVPEHTVREAEENTVLVPVEEARAQEMPHMCAHGCSVWGDVEAHERAHELAGFTPPEDVPVPDHADTVPRTWGIDWDRAPEHTVAVPVEEARVLTAVPDILTVHVPAPEDDDLIQRARTLSTDGVPTVRALKKHLNVGTPRAQRLRDRLAEEKGSTP